MPVHPPPLPFDFNNAFIDYGEGDNISQEIKSGLYQALITNIKSQDFARDEGVGIESIENEQASFIQYILYQTQVVAGIGAYNESVADSHKVVTSQDLIAIDNDPRDSSVLNITVRYYELRSLAVIEPNLQEVNVPATVG